MKNVQYWGWHVTVSELIQLHLLFNVFILHKGRGLIMKNNDVETFSDAILWKCHSRCIETKFGAGRC